MIFKYWLCRCGSHLKTIMLPCMATSGRVRRINVQHHPWRYRKPEISALLVGLQKRIRMSIFSCEDVSVAD